MITLPEIRDVVVDCGCLPLCGCCQLLDALLADAEADLDQISGYLRAGRRHLEVVG